MRITWNGHACFTVESAGFRVVLDPYKMEGYPELHVEGDLVLCSHGHADHSNAAAVTLTGGKENPFTVDAVATFHDDKGGALRGSNTMRVLRAEGLTVVHCGDLGHFPTEGQLAAIAGADALLIPVGGYYTIDAAAAKRVCDAAKPRVIVPMHYRHGAYGLRSVGTLEAFLSLYPADAVTRLEGSVFDLTADAPRGVLVPRFIG